MSKDGRDVRLAAWALLLVPALLAADGKPPKPEDEKPPRAEEIVGDIANVRALDSIKIQGVGLVIGLNDTGSNPEPSVWRSQLLDRMRKAQVPDAESWLESPTTSLVILQGTIPPGITTRDRFDIDVSLTAASTTTSLEGGYLLMTELTVTQVVDGKSLDGQVMAEVHGPVLIGNSRQPDSPRAGRILGGARVKKDLPYQLVLKRDRQGYRTATLLQNVINARFFSRRSIEQVGMAEAKRPEMLVLNVPQVYHHNQIRYFQVIERLHVVDTPDIRAQRQQRWAAELLDPKTAGQAALRLEGIGRNAIPMLQAGLEKPDPQVRFFAAEALAYLNDPSGADELARAAIERPEFRAFALAALAAMDQPASVLRLRELLSQADPKLRYGAFNSLRVIDEHDPYLGRVPVLRAPRGDEPPDNETALKLHSAPSSRAARPEDPFELYVVDCEGPPLVHVARTRRCEVVVFGRSQHLLTPVVLGGSGPVMINAALDDDRVQITRIGPTTPGGEMRVESPCQLDQVILHVANLGATYPELLQILRAADRQKNLQGPLVEDALPDPQRAYDAAQIAGIAPEPTRDAAVGKASLGAGDDPKPTDSPDSTRRRGPFQRLGQRLRRR